MQSEYSTVDVAIYLLPDSRFRHPIYSKRAPLTSANPKGRLTWIYCESWGRMGYKSPVVVGDKNSQNLCPLWVSLISDMVQSTGRHPDSGLFRSSPLSGLCPSQIFTLGRCRAESDQVVIAHSQAQVQLPISLSIRGLLCTLRPSLSFNCLKIDKNGEL